jgi:hypothetical protein
MILQESTSSATIGDQFSSLWVVTFARPTASKMTIGRVRSFCHVEMKAGIADLLLDEY